MRELKLMKSAVEVQTKNNWANILQQSWQRPQVEDHKHSSGNINREQLFGNEALVSNKPASSLQSTESFSLGWAWKAETPGSKELKDEQGQNTQMSKYAHIFYDTRQNNTSIGWGIDVTFLPSLSTTRADTLVWPMKTPFTRKTAVSYSVDSAKGL